MCYPVLNSYHRRAYKGRYGYGWKAGLSISTLEHRVRAGRTEALLKRMEQLLAS
jgi:hypothetical protein